MLSIGLEEGGGPKVPSTRLAFPVRLFTTTATAAGLASVFAFT